MTAQSNADIQGSIRGRLGVAWDRVLIYATGGVAFAGVNLDLSLSGVDAAGVPFFATGSGSRTLTGWTVGGGSNMPSPTIGRSGLSTALPNSPLSLGMLCFPGAVFSTGTFGSRRIRSRPA
jgi:hypothetical protein